MSTNIQDIKGAVKTKLLGVSGIQDVYKHEVDKPTNGKYPFATVTVLSGEGRFGDTIRNIRDIQFSVRIYQERTAVGFGSEKAERLTDEMIDEILTAFDADTTLSGMVKFIRPLSFNTEYIDREIGDTRVAEFIVDCQVVVPSTN